jgi:mycothiol synthase
MGEFSADEFGGLIVPGIAFRGFGGESDFAGMAAVINASADADGVELAETAEGIALNYSHLVNCDLRKDFILAEAGGSLVGYARGYWEFCDSDATYVYGMVLNMHPSWKGRGLDRALLSWLELRLGEIAAGHPREAKKLLEMVCQDGEESRVEALESRGFQVVRHFQYRLRDSLDEIPGAPLPEGLELRPALPGHYRAVWEAFGEAFADHWGFTKLTEEEYSRWLEDKRYFQPELWQVAWDKSSGRVAGHVLTYIDREENEKYERSRGYTERIGVLRPYRGRGLASALISRSLLAQREAGMKESALHVDSESLTGATRLYDEWGFRAIKDDKLFRKPLRER